MCGLLKLSAPLASFAGVLWLCVVLGAVVGHFSHPIAGMTVTLLLPYPTIRTLIRLKSSSQKDIPSC